MSARVCVFMSACVCVYQMCIHSLVNISATFILAYNPGDGDGWPVDLAHVEPFQYNFVEGGIGASG